MKIRPTFVPCFLAMALVFASCASVGETPVGPTLAWRSLNWKQMHLEYRDYPTRDSDDEAIVFVHCWTCDGSFWREQIPALQGRARILVVDLPGHGRSDKPAIEYSMDLFARSLDAVLRDAGVDKATLVGHSMGTPIIRQFYRLFPEKVRALIAVDGALRPFLTDPEQIEAFLARFDSPQALEGVRAMVDSMFPANASMSLREGVKATMAAAPAQVRRSAMQGMLDSKIWAEDPIAVPLLVIHAKSNIWPADYESFVRRLAPDSEYRVLEGVGHFLMLENPAAFNAALIAFLEARGIVK